MNDNYERELYQINKKDYFKLKFNQTKRWCIDCIKRNPEVVATVVTAVCGLAWKGYKAHKRTIEVNALQTLKDRYIYDRSLGHYWKLNRTPKASEWSEIARRRKSGQDYYEILMDLRLL